MKYPDDFVNKVVCGDCLEVMKEMPNNSIDTVITDPPYNLSTIKRFKAKDSGEKWNVKSGVFHRSSKGFMGKEWDNKIAFLKETWEEPLRVAKPGATLLCFGGTRTYHRLACAIEDAGWILKDCIMWLYGSGFPKATDISKQLDKKGEENKRYSELSKKLCDYLKESREKVGASQKDIAKHFLSKTGGITGCVWNWENGTNIPTMEQWKKLKDILKLDKEKFIDMIERAIGKRIEAEREVVGKHTKGNSPFAGNHDGMWNDGQKDGNVNITFPSTPQAKLWNGWKSHGLKPAYEPILVAMKPNEGSYAENALKHGVAGLNIDGGRIGTDITKTCIKDFSEVHAGRFPTNIILDEKAAEKLGEPSRFFYIAKASKAERNRGCKELDFVRRADRNKDNGVGGDNPRNRTNILKQNHHPTVKPLKLMEYLCILTKTPTGGVVLDPFLGSGTTAMACVRIGRKFIGIEKEPGYCEIAARRIQSEAAQGKLFYD